MNDYKSEKEIRIGEFRVEEHKLRSATLEEVCSIGLLIQKFLTELPRIEKEIEEVKDQKKKDDLLIQLYDIKNLCREIIVEKQEITSRSNTYCRFHSYIN